MTLSDEAKDFLISEIKDSFKKSVICRKICSIRNRK